MKVYAEDILAAPLKPSKVSRKKTVREKTLFLHAESTSRYWTVMTLLLTDVVALCTVINVLLILGMITDLSLPAIKPLLFAFLLFPLAYTSFGLYRTVVLKPEMEISSFTKANLAVIAGLSVPVLFAPRFQVEMVLWLCTAAPIVVILVPFLRVVMRIMFSRANWWGKTALVLSDSMQGQNIMQRLQRHPETGIKPVLLLSHKEAGNVVGSEHIHGISLHKAIAQQHNIDSVILALGAGAEFSFLKKHREVPVFQSVFLSRTDSSGHVTLEPLKQAQRGSLSLGNDQLAMHCRYLFKRAVDITGALIGLALCAPLCIVISVLIKFTSKGPIFFKQTRMGRNGRSFKVLKFRTMYLNAEEKLKEILANDPILRQEYEIFHKLRNDPRITSIGKVLRRYSLDEFPQLWNVVMGDMSLVGPRAYIPRELPKMRNLEDEVLKCPPGITGLWQVSGRNQLSFDERVSIDVHYSNTWSLALDFYILLKTIPVVLTGNGAS